MRRENDRLADAHGTLAIALPHLLRPAPLRKRLWQAAVLLVILTLSIAGMNGLLPRDKSITPQMLGHDFIAFYTAGTFVRQGRASELYVMDQVAAFQSRVVAEAGLDARVSYDDRRFGPWWNPPFYAWVFVPFSLLPFGQAVAAWTLLNLAALGVAVVLLMRMLAPQPTDIDTLGRPMDYRTTGLVPLLILLSMPFIQAISHGQNTLMSLLLLSLVATFWRNKRAVLAGAACALLAYKPQLAAVVACVLVASLGWRALVGLCFVGSSLVLITQWTLPGALIDYLHRLPGNVRWMQVEHAYLWERHATLKAFWRLLVQGRGPGEMNWLTTVLATASVLAILVLLARAIRRQWARPIDDAFSGLTERVWRDRLIAATFCCAPLLMPFYFDYDLLLLAVPAVLLAGEMLARPAAQPRDASLTWLARAWLALYVWTMLNPGLAASIRLNGSVVLLSAIAVLMTLRATPPRTHASAADDRPPIPVTVQRRAA